jgi:hypothetical protein
MVMGVATTKDLLENDGLSRDLVSWEDEASVEYGLGSNWKAVLVRRNWTGWILSHLKF